MCIYSKEFGGNQTKNVVSLGDSFIYLVGVGGGWNVLNFLQTCFTWVGIIPNSTTEDSFKHLCVNYRCFQIYFGSFNH